LIIRTIGQFDYQNSRRTKVLRQVWRFVLAQHTAIIPESLSRTRYGIAQRISGISLNLSAELEWLTGHQSFICVRLALQAGPSLK